MTVVHVVNMVTMFHALVSAFFAMNMRVCCVLLTSYAVVFALSAAVVIFVVFAFSRALVIFLAVSRAFVIFAVSAISAALVSRGIGRCSRDFVGLACTSSENK